MARLEKAIDAYVRYRGEVAARNSLLPGLDAPESTSTENELASVEMDISSS